MAIVDELVIRLGLDNKEFKKGAKETEGQLNKVKGAAATTSKNLQEHGKKGAEFFTQLQKSAIKFFGVMAVGTAAFRGFANLIASGAHLSRLATNLGTSANSLHKWGQAVKQSGGTAQGFEATIRGLSAEITAWKTGGTAGPMLQGLQALGVSLVDAGGKAKSLETLLLDMGEAVQRRAPNRADQANLLAQWGLDEGTINLVLKRRKDAEALIASQPGMDDKAAKKAQDINEKWLALVEEVRGKFRELAIEHFPAIKSAVEAISKAFTEMSPVITTIIEGFTKLNEMTDGWLTKVLLVLGAFKLMKGALPGMPGGGGGAPSKAPGAAAAGLGFFGKMAAGAAMFLGNALSPVSKTDEKEYDLKSRAALGDREAARAYVDSYTRRMSDSLGMSFSQKDKDDLFYKVLGGKNSREVSGKVTLNQALGKKSNISDELKAKLDAAEKANNLPTGILGSIMNQETGGNKAYLDDPSKYHYGLNANGQRIAPHTGKVSTAFGPFGILESTAKNPGYGVPPLKDKSFDSQLEFISRYLSERISRAGSLFQGLSGYGEGSKYASQVLGRLPGGGMSGLSNAAAATSTSTQNITIGKIDIQTAATDAAGVARSLRDSLVREMNYGTR